MTSRTANIANQAGATRTVGVAIELPVARIRPNSWNPNVQPDWMYERELASISEFGFVDPVTVRDSGDYDHEIIDGEHRWKAAVELGYESIPCWNVGYLSDEDAQLLTLALNPDHNYDHAKLQTLLNDLLARRPEQRLREIVPFSDERFDEILDRHQIDWSELDRKRDEMQREQENTRWKELVYRMPADAASVVEQAIARVQEREGFAHPWQALEMIAADSLA